jgi:hypothetical protein
MHYITGVFKFGVEAGVEEAIVNALHGLRITDQLFKFYVFTRVVRSQSTPTPTSTPDLKNTLYFLPCYQILDISFIGIIRN